MIHGRLAEWQTSAIMVVCAIILALPGDTLLNSPGYAFLRRLGFDEIGVAIPMLAIGLARMMALYINGSWRRTPVIRLAGACVGAAGFGFLAVSFAWPFFAGLTPGISLGAGFCLVPASFDLMAAYRAGHDARIART